MNIAILSKSDRLGGGGGRCAEDLVNFLKQNNYNVNHFARSSKYTNAIKLYTEREKWIYHRLRSIGFQEIIPFEKKVIRKHDNINYYDIFHFHDISTAISPLTLKWLSNNNKRIIWTLHDCSMFTGGCVNPLNCIKYQKICYNCPQLGNLPLAKNIDLSFLFHMIKKYILKNSNIIFVTPSKWLAEMIYKTGYINTYPIIIANGVDLNIFKKYNKDEIRMKLNLPINRFIILLSSSGFDNPYKGISYAIEIITKLKEINPYILMVGKPDEKINSLLKNFDKFETGYIEDKNELNKYYSCADIFLNTTIADNLPITVLEVMASMTPVYGFYTGGIPEIITQNEDGFLVKDKNILQLIDKILYSYKTKEFIKMGINARKKIERYFSIEIFYQKYIELYNSTFAHKT